MSTTLITANEGIPSEGDHIVISDMARPHLQRWMRENGYIHESEAPTVTVHRMLATTPAPVVLDLSDDKFTGAGYEAHPGFDHEDCCK